MFKLRRKISTDAFSNLIAEGTTVDGAVNFSGIIKIQGAVKGDVLSSVKSDGKVSDDCIIVDETGAVSSDKIQATDVVIAGDLTTKTIWAENTLRVLKTAVITGATIYYRNLEIEPGAQLHECHMKHLDKSSEAEIV